MSWNFNVDRCSMAALHSRFRRIIYGTSNSEMGGIGGRYKIHVEKSLNHHFEVYRGILEHKCKELCK